MRSTNQILLLICTCISSLAFSQVQKLKLTEVYITAGSTTGLRSAANQSDFQMLAPNSQIMNNNPGEFAGSPSLYSYNGSSGSFSVLTGIQFLDKEKNELRNNPTLRIGLSYGRVNQLNGSSIREEQTAYDTLVGQNSGNVHYLDSVTRKYMGGDYMIEQVSIEASLIFRTNPDLRWSVYGGAGFNFGMTMNAETELYYYEEKYTKLRAEQGPTPHLIYTGSDLVTVENYRNKSSFGGSLYLPLGVDFTLGDTSPFWSMISLYLEAHPGIRFQNIPELDRTITQSFLTMNSGIRVKW